MSRPLTVTTLTEFVMWLTDRRPLGLSMSSTQLAVGDASGTAWVWDVTDDHLTEPAVAAIVAASRKVWSVDAGGPAVRLAKRLRSDVDEFTWLHCETAAYALVNPLEFYKVFPVHGAARDAVSTARRMVKLTTETTPATRKAVMLTTQQERLWRQRRRIGRRVDEQIIAFEIPDRRRKLTQLGRAAGTDLDPSTARTKVKLHAWLGEVGIQILDGKGRPTLERDYYDKAVIPDTPEATVRWAQFRAARSVVSRMSKFLELRHAWDSNHRVFSVVNVRGSRTGRQSVTKPALQNIARECRPVIMCDPGMALVGMDFDQIEPRVAAALSGDKQMLADLLEGDIYARMSEIIWPGKGTKEYRDRAKTLLLAIMYSRGRPALAEGLGISILEAQALMDQVWLRYPDLRRFTDELRAQARRGEPYITTTGRPAPTPRGKEYAALNTAIQSEAADVMAEATARVAAVTGTAALFLGVHDELILEVEANRTEWARQVLMDHMSTTFAGVPISGKAEVLGQAWRKPS